MIRSTAAVLLAVTSALAAQQKPKVVRPKPKVVKPKQVDPKLMAKLKEALEKAQKKGQLKIRQPLVINQPFVQNWPNKAVFKRGWIGPGRGRAFGVPANPLLQGALKQALDVFDALRTKLYTEQDPKRAKQLLADVEQQLMVVRRALFDRRKTPVVQVGNGLFQTGTLTAAQQVQIQQLVVLPMGNQRMARIGNRWVRYGNNPIFHGDYEKRVAALGTTRGKLDKERDPTKAKALVDQLTRDVLAARAALWRAHFDRR